MDPLTHGLAGTVIFNLGFRRKAAFWVLLLSSLAPDFDYITRFWGLDIFLRYHRGITHSIFASIIISIMIGFIFGRKKDFIYYSFLAFLAYTAHLFMDLTNQYGTRILAPLDWHPYSLDLMFIIDPYITAALLLSVILSYVNKKRTAVIALITVFVIMTYGGVRYYLHGVTRDFLRDRLDANTYKVCPLPNDFLRWWFIAKSGNEIKVGFADLFTQRICIQETYRTNNNDPLIERSKDTRVVHNFLYFARYPYAEVLREKEKTIVIWRELAYSFRAGDHFVAKVIYDKEGRVLDSYCRL
jgi:inner membrane protein